MISALPPYISGEPFVDIVNRYGAMLRFKTCDALMEHIFGVRHLRLAADLPGMLGAFARMLPVGHSMTAESLLMQHTIYPYVTAFTTAAVAASLKTAMIHGNGQGTHTRAGLTASKVPLPRWLRFCPCCVEMDRQTHGICFWRLVHQTWPVLVCPNHAVWLEESPLPVRDRSCRESVLTADAVVLAMPPRPIDPQDAVHKLALALARDVVWLLTHPVTPDAVALRERYLSILAEQGLATFNGLVRTQCLLEAFCHKFPPATLAMFGVSCNSSNTKNWLSRLIRMPYSGLHPTYHLLLIHFLGLTAETFFAQQLERSFFGDGPWPCLNPVCLDYQKPVISTCHIEFRADSQGRPVGVFACRCGYTYMRVGPDRNPGDHLRKTRIEVYGPIWEQILREVWSNSRKTLKAIAAQFHTDTMTIKRNAARLKLSFDRPNGPVASLSRNPPTGPTSGTRTNEERLMQYQQEWERAVAANPGAGVQLIAQLLPTAYSALFRHCPTWIAEHTPRKSEVIRPVPQHSQYKAIWRGRDRVLVRKVTAAAKAIRHQSGRPVRVTINRIASYIGQRGLIQNKLSRLPRTAHKLARCTETPQDFAIRRLQYIASEWRESGRIFTRSQLLNAANAWPYNHNQKVQHVLTSLC